MTTNSNSTSQNQSRQLGRNLRRAGAALTATAAAMAALLLSSTAAGADWPATAPANTATNVPATQPTDQQPAAPATQPTANAPATQPSDFTAADSSNNGAKVIFPMQEAGAATQPAQPAQPTAAAETPATAATTQPSMVVSGLGPDGTVTLARSHSVLLKARVPLKRVSVAEPEIADVRPVSPDTILVTGKGAGDTQLILWDDQEHSQVVDVCVKYNLAMLQRELHASFPGVNVQVGELRDGITLRGQVPSLQVAEQIMEVAQAFGKAHNFLEIGGQQQVMLQVRFAEVSKTAIRQLGVNFGGTDGVASFTTAGFGGGANTFNLANTTGSILSYTTSSANVFGGGAFNTTVFDYFITALQQNNLVKVLAEPNVVATSGQEANFLAGGEIPIPVPQPGNGGNTITIEFKQYGVQLNFIPMVMGSGKIRLKVSPEVSQLDYSTSVSIAGTTVPGFLDRKLNTTVELNDGQSLALAGLLNDQVQGQVQALPILGQLPILGALFRDTSFQRSETELVVLVTPRLVSPLNPAQVPALPGEHYRYPTDAQIYVNADLGGNDLTYSKPPPQFHGTYGFSSQGAGGVIPSQP